MKLTNLLSAVAIVATASSLCAIDAEFTPLNRVQAQVRGSQYKAQLGAVVRAQPHHAHLAGADMDIFYTAISKVAAHVDVIAAIDHVRSAFIANAGAVVDGYAANDGDAILGGAPVDAAHRGKTRLQVKQDIATAINNVVVLGKDGPVDGNYGTIKAFIEDVQNDVIAAVTAQVNMYAANDGDAIIDGGAHAGQTRGVFLANVLAALDY
jgi:hypothetical protein